MDWIPVATTILGASIGIGSTLIVDRSRVARERARQWGELKRQSYIQFLTAMHATQQELCLVALNAEPATGVPRGVRARDAFRAHDINAACEQVMLVAPEHIRVATNAIFDLLREYRDALDSKLDYSKKDHKGDLDRYRDARDALRQLLHDDLRRAIAVPTSSV